MTADRIVIEPAERRAAVLRIIRGARKRLGLTIFRCDDAEVLDEVRTAVARGVVVDVLLTRRASGWRRRLDQLCGRLERMGANVMRHGPRATKHHAKYIVADSGPLLVASFNLTRKCFHETCDFAVVTTDPGAVTDAWRLFDSDLVRRAAARSPRHATRGSSSALSRPAASVRDLLVRCRDGASPSSITSSRSTRASVAARKVRDGVRVDHVGTRVVAAAPPMARLHHRRRTRRARRRPRALQQQALGLQRELGLLVDGAAAVRRLEAFFDRAHDAAARG